MFDAVLLMLVLFNPLLMVAYLNDVMNRLDNRTFVYVIVRAFLVSGIVFVTFAWGGDTLFTKILQVRFASFLIFGGVVFALIALRSIIFGAQTIGDLRGEPEQLSGAIAMPFMIGPGTISASVLIGTKLNIGLAAIAIFSALFLSCLFLILMKWIFDLVSKNNEKLIERYIEIIGRASALIIGTIAVEMVLKGVDLWLGATA